MACGGAEGAGRLDAVSNFLEEFFGGGDSLFGAEPRALVFDTDPASIPRIKDNLHHARKVDLGFITIGVEIIALRRNCFCEGHQVGHTLVAIVLVEIAEVWQRAAVVHAGGSNSFGEPFAVRTEASVVLDDNIDAKWFRIFGQTAKSIRSELDSFFVGLVGFRVDANRVASEKLGGIDPFVVILDRLSSFRVIAVAESPFAVDHDQHVGNAEIVGPFFHLGEVFFILGLIFEELIDVFDAVDVELFFGNFREVEVIELFGEQRFVERPLSQRDLEARFRFILRPGCLRSASSTEGGGSGSEKASSIDERSHRLGGYSWKGDPERKSRGVRKEARRLYTLEIVFPSSISGKQNLELRKTRNG